MESNPLTGNWKVWGDQDDPGLPIYYQRATGELPEMESSKAVAKLVNEQFSPGDRILDVGCGAGHYLRSLKREIPDEFQYTGIDATEGYLKLARQAWDGQGNVEFRQGDIFSLDIDDASFDIVMCCNVLQHLPSVQTPMSELVRVARRRVVIRTLVGNRSFRVQDVHSSADYRPEGSIISSSDADDEFDERGEPLNFAYYNIYSKAYIERLLSRLPKVTSYDIVPDQQFDAERLSADLGQYKSTDATSIMNGWQVNGYVLLPWNFISIGISGG